MEYPASNGSERAFERSPAQTLSPCHAAGGDGRAVGLWHAAVLHRNHLPLGPGMGHERSPEQPAREHTATDLIAQRREGRAVASLVGHHM